MSEVTNPILRALLSFSVFFLLGWVLLAFIMSIVDFQSSAMGVVLMLAASMAAGQAFGQRESRLMTSEEKLYFAVFATIVGCILSAVVVYALFAWNGIPITLETLAASLGLPSETIEEVRGRLWFGVVIAALLSVLVSYFGVGFGAKLAARGTENRGA
jgi:hypothetical protein